MREGFKVERSAQGHHDLPLANPGPLGALPRRLQAPSTVSTWPQQRPTAPSRMPFFNSSCRMSLASSDSLVLLEGSPANRAARRIICKKVSMEKH